MAARCSTIQQLFFRANRLMTDYLPRDRCDLATRQIFMAGHVSAGQPEFDDFTESAQSPV